jgi:hypothetical protein
MTFVEFVTVKAQNAGWKVSEVHSDTMVSLDFKTEVGSDSVFIRPCGKDAQGNSVVEFSSKGLAVPSDRGLAGSMALVLMERNGDMMLRYWGIESIGESQYFTVFSTLLANTMDDDEFQGAVRGVLSERTNLMKWLHRESIDF